MPIDPNLPQVVKRGQWFAVTYFDSVVGTPGQRPAMQVHDYDRKITRRDEALAAASRRDWRLMPRVVVQYEPRSSVVPATCEVL
jgi:hypothetical protein